MQQSGFGGTQYGAPGAKPGKSPHILCPWICSCLPWSVVCFLHYFYCRKALKFYISVFALLGCWSICPSVYLSIVCCSNIKSDWLKKSHVHTSDISIWISLSKTIILIFWVCVSKPKGELHVCQVPNFEKLFKSLSYLHVFSKVKPLFYISCKIHLPF